VGVSGANFAIAETGSMVVVESEGNGRMCLTLPRTLISVVGIEKILPSWRDLEVFLALLPRSSTAERMNPYTSTWTGITPGDGPQDFHLVLLDNGRTSALADQTGRQAPTTAPSSSGSPSPASRRPSPGSWPTAPPPRPVPSSCRTGYRPDGWPRCPRPSRWPGTPRRSRRPNSTGWPGS